MYECAIMNKIVYLIPARALVTPLTRVASLDTPPLSLSLAVGCAHWFPPSVGQHHFTPTGSLCGPGDRPNPPRPRSHQVTHIVRFATHPAQKSISELVRAPKRYFRPLKQLNSCKPGFKEHGDMRGYGYHGKMGKMENMLSLVMLKCNYSLKEIAFPSETLYVIYLEG